MRRTDIDSTTTFPLENPVSVTLGDGLVAGTTGPGWVLFSRLVPELRERLRARTGITIPGIRFRGGPGLEPAQFQVRWEGSWSRPGRCRACRRRATTRAASARSSTRSRR
ncbi:hypothetical protein [Cellulomonas sp. ATA003]|uniref:hypothetical protein n=1 Tax=Cellulomonas sp. ATA003 TaxID=3073064 RepID=UPI002873B9D8|nr:hypothetical protein [Cellulomonas sp. ATA003]WNB87287.1 hypothetical protein REH70_09405 [Cellulomonas sp. ATA003]